MWGVYIISFFVGILAGTLTGLVPGIHINLIAVLLLGSSFLISKFSPFALVVFIVAMAITHTFIDYIPSVFLGAPDQDTVLSILPGHKMLIKGKAHEAVILTLYGSFSAILIILIFSPLFIYFLNPFYNIIKTIIPFILIFVSSMLIYFEKKSKFWAVIIFLLAGFLGISSFSLPLKEPLLPLLTGLFGASSLITSIIKKQKIPKQQITKLKKIKIKKRILSRAMIASVISAPLCSFLPGLGSGQAAVIGSEVITDKKYTNEKEFLILLGAINTIVIGLSFIALYAIGKPRTGADVAVSKLLTEFSIQHLLIILGIIFLSGIIAFPLTIFLSKFVAKNITKIKYSFLAIITLLFLSLIVIIFSGFLGLIVFIISSFLGLTCIFTGIKRIHLMGSLLLPVILFYIL
jgi:putative membrane protein